MGVKQSKDALSMSVEERKAKYTFIYVRGRPVLNPQVAKEAGLVVKSLEEMDKIYLDEDLSQTLKSSKEYDVPAKRGRRIKSLCTSESEDFAPKPVLSTPPKRNLEERGGTGGSPFGRKKAIPYAPRNRKSDGVPQFLVFCQKHRDEVCVLRIRIVSLPAFSFSGPLRATEHEPPLSPSQALYSHPGSKKPCSNP